MEAAPAGAAVAVGPTGGVALDAEDGDGTERGGSETDGSNNSLEPESVLPAEAALLAPPPQGPPVAAPPGGPPLLLALPPAYLFEKNCKIRDWLEHRQCG